MYVCIIELPTSLFAILFIALPARFKYSSVVSIFDSSPSSVLHTALAVSQAFLKLRTTFLAASTATVKALRDSSASFDLNEVTDAPKTLLNWKQKQF